jgi:hypothetical protein
VQVLTSGTTQRAKSETIAALSLGQISYHRLKAPPLNAGGPSRQQNYDRRVVAHTERRKMPPDQEFLLYPLDTGENPLCRRCHLSMLLAATR